jgi:hypothetical protein
MEKLDLKNLDIYELDNTKTYLITLKCPIEAMPDIAHSMKSALSSAGINNVVFIPNKIAKIKQKD